MGAGRSGSAIGRPVRLADGLGRVELRYFPDAADAEFVKAADSARAEAVQAGQDARMAGEQCADFSMEVAHLSGFWVEYQIPGAGQFREGPFAVLPDCSVESQLSGVRVECGFDGEDATVGKGYVEIMRPGRRSGDVARAGRAARHLTDDLLGVLSSQRSAELTKQSSTTRTQVCADLRGAARPGTLASTHPLRTPNSTKGR